MHNSQASDLQQLVGRSSDGRVRVAAVDRETAAALIQDFARQDANQGRFRGLSEASAPEYVRSLVDDPQTTTLVLEAVTSTNRVPIGISQVFGKNLVHRTAQLGVVLSPELQGLGWPIEGVIATAKMAFRELPLRRIYLELPAFNNRLGLSDALKRLCGEPVVLPEHQFHQGRYWDVEIYWIESTDVLAASVAGTRSWVDLTEPEAFVACLQAHFDVGTSYPYADYLRTPLAELGFDSLSLLELVLEIEASAGIEIPMEAVGHQTTAGDFLAWATQQ